MILAIAPWIAQQKQKNKKGTFARHSALVLCQET
jgi:hypothetical protein